MRPGWWNRRRWAPLSDGGVVWRIIRSEPADGAWNMAVDEALLEAALAGGPGSGPTLRFYTWQPPCLRWGTSTGG